MSVVRRALLWTGRGAAALLAVGGLYLLVADAARSLSRETLSLKPLGQVWYEMDAGSLNLTQAVVERYIHPRLWDPVITTLLNWPGWVVPLALAALLGWLTWPRTRHDGV